MGTHPPTVAVQTMQQARRIGRLLLLVLYMAAICGCSQIAGGTWSVTKMAITERFKTHAVSPESVSALPYAQLWVTGLERDALLILGNDDDGQLSWYSGDRVIVFTRDGMVTGTQGLPGGDLVGIQSPNLPANLLEIASGQDVQRYYDWMPGYRYGIEVSGRWRLAGEETLELPAIGKLRLRRLEETLSGKGVSATNIYWIDPADGFIWKSRQWIKSGTSLELTILKPYQRERLHED